MYRWYFFAIVLGLFVGVLFHNIGDRIKPQKSAISDLHRAGVDISLADQLNVTQLLDEGFGQVPEFLLLSENANEVTASELGSSWTLFVFGFTHCPDVCPTALRAAGELLTMVPKETLNVVFVTVDPDRDDVDSLVNYTAYFSDDIVPLTGTTAELQKMYESFGIKVVKRFQNPDNPDDYTVDHTVPMYLVDSHRQIRARFVPPFFTKSIYKDFLNILSAS